MTDKHEERHGLPDMKLRDPAHGHSRRKVLRATRLASIAVVVVLFVGLGWNLVSRWFVSNALEARATENSVTYVRVVQPAADKANSRFTLPGTLQGMLEAQIYARTNGYVKQWHKNIGERAKKGEVLATLNIPEVEKQVEEAGATFQMTKIAFERWTRLRAEDAVSQQELDEKTSAYHQAQAVLQRLREQVGYGRVIAPFDGIVTRRNVNVGDLVNAGNGGVGQAMFAMAQIEKLHVYIYVPQDQAAQVKVGDSVDVIRTEQPDKPIKARIARTAGAIDLSSRTLQVDVEIANPQRTLLPGAYVEVALKLGTASSLVLPTNTLLFGSAGTQVAVVKDGKVERKPVTLGVNYGRVVEIKSGVSTDDQVIINPPDSIVSGQAVAIEATPSAKPTAPKSGS